MVMKHAFPPGDYDVTPPEKRGTWIPERDFALLEKIAAGLAVTPPEGSLEAYLSIPDVWAHVFVFEQALLAPTDGPPGSTHPLHDRAVAIWRGLLAMLALKEVHSLPVGVRALSWYKPSETFARVAYDLRPQSTMDRALNWAEHLFLVTYEGQPAGLLVPSTIVCPARGGEAVLDANIPWVRDGMLLDPLDGRARIDKYEMESLRETVRMLHRRVRALGEGSRTDDSRRQRISRLTGLLADYDKDLTSRIGGADGVDLRSRPNFEALPTGLSEGSVFAVLAHWYEPVGNNAADASHLRIEVRPEFSDLLAGGLVIDLDGGAGLPWSPDVIRVWGRNKLADLVANRGRITEVKQGAAEAGVLAVTPDELFLPTICRLDQPMFDGHRSGSALASYVLPFTPMVLLFYSPDQLREKVRIVANGSEVTVELAVTFVHGDTPHLLRRTYRGSDILMRQPPQALAVWPDFRMPNWSQYYVFAEGDTTQAAITPVATFAATSMAKVLADGLTVTKVANARDLHRKVLESSALLSLAEGRAIGKLSSCPEAVLCTVVRTGSKDPTPAGIILVPPYREVRPLPGAWSIGIDLGSTNTAVFVRKDGAMPEPLVLNPHILSLFTVTTDLQRYVLWSEFMSHQPRTNPFLTSLYRRNSPAARPEPLFSEYIIDTAGDVAATVFKFGKGDGNAHFNIKWEDGVANRQNIGMFFKNVYLLCLAEAASNGITAENVAWRFAYPQAFNKEHLAHFQLAQKTALSAVGDGRGTIVHGLSESLAAAIYFYTERPAIYRNTSITFDIGGQTTDVTIWQNNVLVWCSSLRIGGQHLLIEFLMRYPELLTALASHDDSLQKAMTYRDQNLKFQPPLYFYEVVVNSQAYRKCFSDHHWVVAGQGYYKLLQKVLHFALAGLLYYAGRSIKLLSASDRFDMTRRSIAVCLGGRGSLMFGTPLESLSPAADCLPYLNAGAGSDFELLDWITTADPKREVAIGLLADTANLVHTPPTPPLVPLGEDVSAGRIAMNYDALTDLSELPVDREWRVATLDELKGFANRFGLPLTGDDENQIRAEIDTELEKDRASLRDQRRGGDLMVAQPPFILGLREYIKIMIRSGRDRATR